MMTLLASKMAVLGSTTLLLRGNMVLLGSSVALLANKTALLRDIMALLRSKRVLFGSKAGQLTGDYREKVVFPMRCRFELGTQSA
jgi:hypothetical protein